MMYLDELLTKKDVVKTINQNMDALLYYVPEINYMIGFDQREPQQNYDLWNHVLLSLYRAEEIKCDDVDVRLALLLHDIAKPMCFVEGEVRTYPDYADESAKTSYKILRRLNYSDKEINKILYLVRNHNRAISDTLINRKPELAFKLYEVQYCDALAQNQKYLSRRMNYLSLTKKKIIKRSNITK